MPVRVSDLANFVGTHVLPFTNPRVVCPPGRVVPQGQQNLIVATPMRSGTHILIDLILNNVPAYRNRPLYIDLDQCAKQSTLEHDILQQVTPGAGYIIKTHMPLGTPQDMPQMARISELIETSQIVTIRRDRDDVCKSLGRWHGLDIAQAEARYGPDYDRFWAFWSDKAQVSIDFKDLFDPQKMAGVLAALTDAGSAAPAARYMPPPSGKSKKQIYFNKMLTRLLGHRAPRVDTTIHTLKS